MKNLHRDDLFAWSVFDEARNIDFHSTFWTQHGGTVIDPLPLSAHDEAHIKALGGIKHVVLTNADHVRDAAAIAARYGANVHAPARERAAAEYSALSEVRWLDDEDHVVPGLQALSMAGSKTPGELALVLERTTLITGDLVRGQRGGVLNCLPEAKLQDRAAALRSIRRLAALPSIDTVIVGDGWPVFHGGDRALAQLVQALDPA